MDLGLCPTKCCLVPTVKQCTSRVLVKHQGGQLCINVQMSIVSAVKTCKQCLQTASASRHPTGASPLEPHWRTFVPIPWTIAPKWGPATALTYLLFTKNRIRATGFQNLAAIQLTADVGRPRMEVCVECYIKEEAMRTHLIAVDSMQPPNSTQSSVNHRQCCFQ